MSQQKVEGKRWVVETLHRVAREQDIPIESLEWGRGSRDFFRDLESLAIVAGGGRVVEKFRVEDLSDCVCDKNVQACLEARIKKIVKSIQDLTSKGLIS